MFSENQIVLKFFTQSVSGNANARMGAVPIRYTALVLLLMLMLMLCVNGIIHNANIPSKNDGESDMAIAVAISVSTERCLYTIAFGITTVPNQHLAIVTSLSLLLGGNNLMDNNDTLYLATPPSLSLCGNRALQYSPDNLTQTQLLTIDSLC